MYVYHKIFLLVCGLVASLIPALAEPPKPQLPVPFLLVSRTPYVINKFTEIKIGSDLGYFGGFSGFTNLVTGQIGFPGYCSIPGLNISYDNEKLVLYVIMPYPMGRTLRSSVSGETDALKSDDVFEVLLQPRNREGKPLGPIYRFIGNANNVLKTERDLPQIGQFNLIWQPNGIASATLMRPSLKCWVGAIRIPFRELGGFPANGDTWGIQCAFHYAEPEITGVLSATRKIDDAERFAKIRFDHHGNINTRPEISDAMRKSDFMLNCVFSNSSSSKIKVSFGAELKKSSVITGEEKVEYEVKQNTRYDRARKRIIIKSNPAKPEDKDTFARIVVRDLNQNQIIYDQYIPYWQQTEREKNWVKKYFANNFKILTGAYPSTGVFDYLIDCRMLKEIKSNASSLKLTLSCNGKKVNVKSMPLQNGLLQGSIQISPKLSPMPEGKYVLNAEVIDRTGKIIAAKTEIFNRKLMPFESSPMAGKEDIVVSPFTEPGIRNKTALCWARQYQHGNDGLLTQLIAKDENILNAPVTFKFKLGNENGKTITLKGTEPCLFKSGKGKIVFRQDFYGSGLTINLEGILDYDGFYHFKATYKPSKKTVDISNLYLEVPLKDKHAILMDFPDKFQGWDISKNRNNGLLNQAQGRLADSRQFNFSRGYRSNEYRRHGNMPPYVWIGDDERGICFSMASERGCYNDDAQPALTVDREGRQVTMRAYFANKPVSLKEGRTVEFALQASPYKAMPENHRLWRSCKANNLRLATYKKNGLYHCGFDRKWTYPYGRFTNLKKMKSWSDDLRARKVYDFIAVSASSCSECGGTPEYLQFWREWGSALGFDKMNLGPLPEYMKKLLADADIPANRYVGVEASSNTSLSNLKYRLWWFAECVDKGGVDHIYQDNPAFEYWYQPFAGYGFIRDDGSKEPESMIWNTRNFLKGCAHIVAKAGIKKSPYVWANMCGAPMPGRSFCRMALTGECPESDKIRLDQIRVWASHQWGFNLQWLFQAPTTGATLKYWRTLCSRLFLLDVTDFLRNTEEYWRWIQALDILWLDDPSIKWHPYYNNDIVKSCIGSKTKISAYTATGRALFIISNQDKNTIVEKVKFHNLAKYGASGLQFFYDAETGEEIVLDNGALCLFVPSEDYRLVLGFPNEFKFAAKKLFPGKVIPPQSMLDSRKTVSAISQQLLSTSTLSPLKNGHKLTEAWYSVVLDEMTNNPDDFVFYDAESCKNISIGDPGIHKSMIYNRRKNLLLLNYYNPGDNSILLNGKVRIALINKAVVNARYVLDPVRGTSYFETLDLPAHSGKIEVIYGDHSDYWGRRKGPFKIGTQTSNMLDAVLYRRKEMGEVK